MSDVSKTNDELITEARFYESPGHVAAYADGTLELLRKLADALEAATLEQDSAGDIRRAVRLWSERFIPGDRWDTEDARDLDAALKCVVEANPDRSSARVPVQGEGYTVEVDGQHFTQAQWEAVQRYCGGSRAVQGEPNDDRGTLMEAMKRGEKVRQAAWSAYGQEPDGEGTKPHSDNWYRAEALMAAGFSRATVPDAATEAKNAWHLSSDVRQARALKAEAERDAALAALGRVAALHHKKTEVGVDGDCATETCDHEDECPTKEFEVCARCWDMCEEADPYFGERGIGMVLWPCPTVAALAEKEATDA